MQDTPNTASCEEMTTPKPNLTKRGPQKRKGMEIFDHKYLTNLEK